MTLLEELLKFEKEYKPYEYNEEKLRQDYDQNPQFLISLLLVQAKRLLDEWRVADADAVDLEEELLLYKLKMEAPQA